MSWQGESIRRTASGVPSERTRTALDHLPSLTKAYVDDHLVGTGKVSKAAIIGKQGGVWAASNGYNVSSTLWLNLSLCIGTESGRHSAHSYTGHY